MRALAWTLLLLLPGVAFAEPAPTVVVHVDDEELVREAWVQQHGDVPGVRFATLDQVLPPEEPAVILGDTEVVGCGGDPVSPADLTAANRAALDSLAMMEYRQASKTLAEVDALLPCLSGAPRPMDLAAYHMLRGIVAFETKGADEASKRFEEGLLVSPFLQWDERFPPSVKPAFDAAVKTAITAERGFLSVSPGIMTSGSLWLDGLAVDPRTRTTTVYEGLHLLQWKEGDAPVRSWMVAVEPGDSLVLVQRADAVADLLAARADALLSVHARDQVLAPIERRPGAALVVAEPAEIMLFHRFEAEAGWTVADVDALDDYRAAGRRMRNGGIGLSAFGGVLAIIGAVALVDGLATRAWVDDAIRKGYDPDDFDEADEDDLEILNESPEARFNNNQSDFRTAGQSIRAGIVLGFVGTAVSIGSAPIIVIGEKRSHAMGLNRGTRKAARAVRATAEAEARVGAEEAAD